jgi:hypothetical protein
MITEKDFLKNVLTMTTEEKWLLVDRAEKWLEAYPALRASVTSWQDAPVKDFDEGLLLCSCLRRAKSFIGSAYKFNAQKCLEMIQLTLKEIIAIAGPNAPRTEKEKKTNPIKAFIPKKPSPDENGNVKKITEEERRKLQEEAMEEESAMDKWRPQNLNAYKHLLPKEMQNECEKVQQKFYMPMREFRSRLESLAENPDSTDEQRKEMAQKLVDMEEKLSTFWEGVDTEYRKVTGKEIPTEPEVKEKRFAEFTKEDIDKMEEGEQKEKVMASRIESNKKYLRRSDLPDDESTRQQMTLRAYELMQWGIELTSRQLKNMKKFGVTIVSVSPKVQQQTLFN